MAKETCRNFTNIQILNNTTKYRKKNRDENTQFFQANNNARAAHRTYGTQ